MFDACVLYNISEDDKKVFNITVGSAVIKSDLKFDRKNIVFLDTKDSKLLRKAVEQMLPFGVINSELIHEKDSLHYPRAGIDDTIAKIMAEKKIAAVFNLGLLLNTSGDKRAVIIRRMKENMRRAIKYDMPVLFASCAKNRYELFNGLEIKTWAKSLGIDNFSRVKKSFNKIFP
ncbi:MAG: hypothetical protein JW791_01250 [Nanoarchaeota archaeon]|nr:hypothetical protein [Nanoarchaeota archaeon]